MLAQVFTTETFDRWLLKLRDARARGAIHARIVRLSLGNPGDVEPVGGGISELRIDLGPGYRVYSTQRGAQIVILLCAGTKSSQSADIKLAKELAADWSPP